MPLEAYPQENLQPANDDAEVWRFMPYDRFVQLMENAELYFCRADLFDDKDEGMPTEEYARLVVESMGPGNDLDATIGGLEQDKEGSFISCWYHFDHETATMWNQYGKQGVAICSRYGLLKNALNRMPDRTMLGLVRYSYDQVGWNILRFITTKRPAFSAEREVRALIWKPEWAGQMRHVDLDNKFYRKPLTPPPPHVLPGLRHSVSIQSLVQSIVVSPEADDGTIGRVTELVTRLGYSIPVRESRFSGFPHVVTDLAEIVKYIGK